MSSGTRNRKTGAGLPSLANANNGSSNNDNSGAADKTEPKKKKMMEMRSQDELIQSPTQRHHKPYNSDPTLPLYSYDDIPEYYKGNKYVLRGYRVYYTTSMCIKSLFRLHNETFNIWTHLLGGVLFLVWALYLFAVILVPDYREGNVFRQVGQTKSRAAGEHSVWPLVLFGFYSLASLMCMGCSAFYHTFTAHLNEPFFRWAHALDYFGITFLIIGSFYPVCYYSFACEPFWRGTYIVMISCFGAAGLLGPFFRKWTSQAFATKKVLFYVCFVGSGLLPTIHMYTLPTNNSPYVSKLLAMLAFYGFGVFLYAFKVPEVFSPGTFDTYGSSHQLFHICVVIAAAIHFKNSIDMYTNFDKLLC